MTDHSVTIYAECFGSESGPWGFKVYHYDSTGNREIVLYKSDRRYRDKVDAENAAADWCEAAGIEAEMM